ARQGSLRAIPCDGSILRLFRHVRPSVFHRLRRFGRRNLSRGRRLAASPSTLGGRLDGEIDALARPILDEFLTALWIAGEAFFHQAVDLVDPVDALVGDLFWAVARNGDVELAGGRPFLVGDRRAGFLAV